MSGFPDISKKEQDRLFECAVRSLLQNTDDYIFIKDKDGICRAASESFLELLGRRPEELNEKEAFGDALAKHYHQDDMEVLKNGKIIRHEMEDVTDKRRGTYIVNTSKFPVRDEENQIIGVVGVSHKMDPTAAEKDIVDQFHEIVNHLPVGCGIVHFSKNTFHLDLINDGIYLIPYLTYEHMQEIQKNDLMRYVDEVDQKNILEEYRYVSTHPGVTGNIETQILGSDKRYHWMNVKFRHAYIKNDVAYYYVTLMDLDPQKKFETDFLLNQHLYENAVETSRLIIGTYDIHKHELRLLNTGYTKEMCTKMGLPMVIYHAPESIFWIISEKDRPAFKRQFANIESGAMVAETEVHFKGKGQVMSQVERLTFRRIYDEHGQLLTVHCCGMNVTAQKREQIEYQRINQQLINVKYNFINSFRLNISQGTCQSVISGDKRYEKINHDLYCHSLKQLIEKSSSYIIDRQTADQVQQAFSRENLLKNFAEGTTVVSQEYQYEHKDKGLLWIRTAIYMVRNPENNEIEGVSYSINITDKKRDDMIMSHLINTNFDYIAILSPVSQMMEFVNKKSWIHFGKEKEPFSYPDFIASMRSSITDEDTRKKFDDMTDLQHILTSLRRNNPMTVTYTTTVNHKLRCSAVQFSWLDAPERDILILHSDITETYEQENMRIHQVQQALLQAKKANESKSDFLSSMSHDIRTPLNGIIGFTDFALQEKDPQKIHEYLKKVKSSSDLLMNLVNDILDLSRIESGKMKIEPVETDVNTAIGSVVDALRPSAEAKHITLEYIPCKDNAIYVDPLLHQKVCLNLLSNAIKYTRPGGKVSIGVSELEPYIDGHNRRMFVEDNGMGMSEEFQKIMFEPFSQEKTSQTENIQGTGLGLHIVKKIVDLLGGTIHVYSQLGKGTRYEIDYYIQTLAEVKERASEVQTYNADFAGKRILLCEDNEINAEIAGMLLKQKKMEVDWAKNGSDGLEKFKQRAPGYYSLILMDIRMPVMDGLEASRIIRQMDREDAQRIPIIALTADVFENNVKEVKQAGMNDIIIKPIDAQKLYAVMEQYMNEK